jgi:O-antigen/teichoic acid export membrane protein
MALSDKLLSLFTRDAILFFTTLLTGVVIARQLGPEMMGIWVLLLLIPGYAEAFGRLRLDLSAVYFLGKGKVRIGEVTFILHLIAIITASIILIVFTYNFDWFYSSIFNNVDKNINTLIYGVLCIIPLRFIYINYSYLLISQENVQAYNKLVIIQALTTSLLTISLIIILEIGVLGALIGNGIGLILAIIYGSIKISHIEKINTRLNFKLVYEMFLYAKHFYLSGLIGFFQGNIASLISAVFVNPAQIAFFAIGKSICEISTRMVPTAMNTLLFPRISNSDDMGTNKDLIARSFRITLFILSISSIVLIFLIDLIVVVLYGVEYLPLIDVFYIMIFGVALSQSSSVFTSYFSGIGRADILSKVTFFPLLAQIALAIILIPDLGIKGAAIALLVSSILLFIFQIFFFLKVSKLKINDIIIQYSDLLTVKNFIKVKILFKILK